MTQGARIIDFCEARERAAIRAADGLASPAELRLLTDDAVNYHAEPIIDRDPDNVLQFARGPGRSEAAPWSALHSIALTDKLDAIRIYNRLLLTPIVLHGMRPDGYCTCGRGEKCPERTRGKHPVCDDWQTSPFDLEASERLLLAESRRNIGLRMGRQRDGRFLICVDVDGPRELLAPLEAEHGKFPETLMAHSGSGGLHLLYWSTQEMGNRVGVVPHVDVRGARGQIVVGPSLHRSGNHYTWLNVREPAVLP